MKSMAKRSIFGLIWSLEYPKIHEKSVSIYKFMDRDKSLSEQLSRCKKDKIKMSHKEDKIIFLIIFYPHVILGRYSPHFTSILTYVVYS